MVCPLSRKEAKVLRTASVMKKVLTAPFWMAITGETSYDNVTAQMKALGEKLELSNNKWGKYCSHPPRVEFFMTEQEIQQLEVMLYGA